MDINPYMEELFALDKAKETMQEKFIKEIGKSILDKFESLGADCIWFSLDDKQKLKDISVNNANGYPLFVIPGDHPDGLTDIGSRAFEIILNGSKRSYYTVRKE